MFIKNQHIFISQGGEMLKMGSANNKTLEQGYEKLLNKNDPLDKQIIKLVKQGRLKVCIVSIGPENEHSSEKYSYKHLPSKGKHTS